jgi:hypothetical protein
VVSALTAAGAKPDRIKKTGPSERSGPAR